MDLFKSVAHYLKNTDLYLAVIAFISVIRRNVMLSDIEIAQGCQMRPITELPSPAGVGLMAVTRTSLPSGLWKNHSG